MKKLLCLFGHKFALRQQLHCSCAVGGRSGVQKSCVQARVLRAPAPLAHRHARIRVV
jgi:hypothetical protein